MVGFHITRPSHGCDFILCSITQRGNRLTFLPVINLISQTTLTPILQEPFGMEASEPRENIDEASIGRNMRYFIQKLRVSMVNVYVHG